MPNPDVSLVIVGYRTRDLLRACLESVYRETRGVTFEVVVVENASGDGSVEMIQREFPDVRLIALDENSGFARGTNLGAEAATGDAIILLNPDTEVVGNAVGQLAEFARAHPKAGVYGGRTVRPNGTLDPVSCGGQMSLWSVTCWAVGLSKAFPNVEMFDPEGLGRWQRDTVRQVAMITGCFMLINRDVWTTLGGFDEQFFMYGEDAGSHDPRGATGLCTAVHPRPDGHPSPRCVLDDEHQPQGDGAGMPCSAHEAALGRCTGRSRPVDAETGGRASICCSTAT